MIEALVESEVRLVLAAGLAASAHGSAYVTWDLDLCDDTEASNLERLLPVLEGWDPVLREDGRGGQNWRPDAALLVNAPVTRLHSTMGDIDLFREMIGVGDYAACVAKSDAIIVEGIEIWVLGLDGLISARRVSPRSLERGPLFSLKALRALKERERATTTAEGPALE